MSADNWRVCPKCKITIDKINESRIKAPGENYGKVSHEAYLKLIEQAKILEPLPESLREDYEIGITKIGVFYVDYSARCDKCGFRHQFKLEKPT